MKNIDAVSHRQALGEALMLIRKQRELFQRDVQEETGIPRSKLSRYENGRQVPSWENLGKLLDVYDITLYKKYGSYSIKELWELAITEITRIRRK